MRLYLQRFVLLFLLSSMTWSCSEGKEELIEEEKIEEQTDNQSDQQKEQVNEHVTITIAEEVMVNEKVTISGMASAGVYSVDILIGDEELGNSLLTNRSYSTSITFNTAGQNLPLKVVAKDVDGSAVAESRKAITVIKPTPPSSGDWAELFVEDVLTNSVAYEDESWGDITGGTPCVAFVCVGLRNHPTHNFPEMYAVVTEGPDSEACSVQLDCMLERTGYFDGPFYDVENLQKGDIVFTDRTVPFQGENYSSHAMIFYEWSNDESTNYAKFIDYHNERGLPYERNATVSGNYDKALFYYRYNQESSDVPYFYQYSNLINPDGSCQNTSMAMVLKHYGAEITPDQLSERWGTKQAQTTQGYEEMFNKEASDLGLNVRSNATQVGSIEALRENLSNGLPTVVHGYFTSYGHVLVALDFDGTHYTVNDPAGKWCEKYADGSCYGNNATEGKYVKYHKDAFEAAIAPDGYVWMHELTFSK